MSADIRSITTEEAGENVTSSDWTRDVSTDPEADIENDPPTATGVEVRDRAMACPECDGELVIEPNHLERICTECGLVVDERRIDFGPEWRQAAESHNQETGYNLQRCSFVRTVANHDYGLGSEIGSGGSSHVGGQERRDNWLRKLHSRSKTRGKKERNLMFACGEIKRVRSALDLPRQVEQRAAYLFRQAHDADLLKGNSIEEMVGAVVFAAAREQGVARLPQEIGEVLGITGDESRNAQNPLSNSLWRRYGRLCRELELSIVPLRPADHIPKLCSELELGGSITQDALRLARMVEGKQEIVGNSPSGIAAGCIYLAAKRGEAGVTQVDIAEEAGVVPPTLRKAKEIIKDVEAEEYPERSNAEGDSS